MNLMEKGVMYFCDSGDGSGFSSAWRQRNHAHWNEPVNGWKASPSESFSLYSFWLGRDSDELLDLTSKPTTTPDFTFTYLEQD